MKCKMISLDTSTVNSGYCIWHNAKYFESGTIKSQYKKEEALYDMITKIYSLLNKEKPDIIVIELTSSAVNADTQRKLTMILGAVLAWCLNNDCEFVTYRVSEWRKIIYESLDIDNSLFLNKKNKVDLKKKAIYVANKIFNLNLDDDNEAEAILIGHARIEFFAKMTNKQDA